MFWSETWEHCWKLPENMQYASLKCYHTMTNNETGDKIGVSICKLTVSLIIDWHELPFWWGLTVRDFVMSCNNWAVYLFRDFELFGIHMRYSYFAFPGGVWGLILFGWVTPVFYARLMLHMWSMCCEFSGVKQQSYDCLKLLLIGG